MASISPDSQKQFDYSRVGAIILIAAGLVWLLASLGVITGAGLLILLTYWPILLIGAGVDYFLGRRTLFGATYTLAAVGLLFALMLIGPSLGLSRGANVVTEQFSEPLGTTQSAQVTLDLASAPTEVFSLQDSADLIDAELTHIGTITFDVRGERDKTVALSRDARGINFGLGAWNQTKWAIGLSPDVPLDLHVDVGSGRATLELAELNLSGFDLSGGSGSAELTLPASPQRYDAAIDAGSGSSRLTVAAGAELDLNVDVGSGSFTADLGRDVDVSLELKGGSGSTQINRPSDANVRVEVRDNGSGSLNVRGLERISGSGDEGVWESAMFDQAEQQILITVRDAGSGSINIR